MAPRTKYHQTCHNSAVSRSAAQYVSNGYDVEADILGYDRPRNLEVDGKKRRPDIIAIKGKKILIIEWETPESMKRDKAQHTHFRKWVRKTKGAHFHLRECSV